MTKANRPTKVLPCSWAPCGRPFHQKRRNGRFCSDACRVASHRSTVYKRPESWPKNERPCLQCGAMYQPRTKSQRFCSAGCRWHAWDERNPRLPSDISRFQADFGHPHAPKPSNALLSARESAAAMSGAPLPGRCRHAGTDDCLEGQLAFDLDAIEAAA